MPKRETLQARVRDLIATLTAATPYRTRARIRARLEALGPKAAPYLLAHLDHPDCLTRWEVVNLLGEFTSPRTLPRLVAFALSEEEVHARWRSFWAVSCFERRASVPLLIAALEGPDQTRRWRAALMLSMLDRREAGPVLLQGLRSRDPWIQWEALNAIRGLRLPGAEAPVSRFLGASRLRDHRQEAVLALGAIGSSQALAAVRTALDDADPDVRWRASLALAGSGDGRWCDALRRQLARETDPEVTRQLREDIASLEARRSRSPSRDTRKTQATRCRTAAR
jgi:HEAT repeat protein